MTPPPEVPRLSRQVLERVLARDVREHVLGDLKERHARIAAEKGASAAARWYGTQALLLCMQPSLLRIGVPAPALLFHGILTDMRLALRGARREPVTTAAIVVSLALAIGSVTVVFGAVDRFLIRTPVGIQEPDRVTEIYRLPLAQPRATAAGIDGFWPIDSAAFRALIERSGTLREGALISPKWYLSVGVDGGEPERLAGAFVSENYFDLLGVAPFLGRFLEPGLDSPRESGAVVITHTFWQRRLGGDSPVGRTLEIEGREHMVVGVAPPDFLGTSVAREVAFWAPLSSIEAIPVYGRNATDGMFIGIARLEEGVPLAQVQAELERIGEQVYEGRGNSRGSTFRVATLGHVTVDPNRRRLYRAAGVALFGGVSVTLLIACLNVANLLLARAVRRRREFAVRVALGAGRGRLVRLLLTESTLLFLAGGLGGVGLLIAVRPWLASLRPPDRFFYSDPTIDLPSDVRVLGFAVLVSLLAAVLAGLLPALRAARADPRNELQQPTGRARVGGVPARDLFLLLQVACSLVALAGAGLFARGFERARRIDPGFRPEQVGMVAMNLHYRRLERDELQAFYRRVLEEVGAVPGVEAAAVSRFRPLEFGPIAYLDHDPPVDGERIPIRHSNVTPGYFSTMGIPLLAGRDFHPEDGWEMSGPSDGGTRTVVINVRLAELFWPGDPPENAVGRRIGGPAVSGSAEVVGVIPTGPAATLGEQPTPTIYRAVGQVAPVPTSTLFFRTEGRVEELLPVIAERVRAIDPRVVVHDVEPASALIGRALWGARGVTGLVSGLAAVALFLAALGIYGVVSGVVGERRREIGIRIAIGAAKHRVTREVVGRISWVVAGGILLGLSAVLAGSRAVEALLYGLPPTDRLALGGACALLLLTALLSAYLPARRAGGVDPIEVIRAE